ncbi:uncharacterized protein LOC124266090 [Haliotis rubra]|uniref:uncharacterized protein LOC124266090 n=1 Tax=Haliotis rubra TaxID=36100 RepID=UPI001EE50E18|nr:uncharacterized protein LOC124266090 [Haliotis rubra]
MKTVSRVALVGLVCSVNLAAACLTADDCPFLYCCVKPMGNSVDNQFRQQQLSSGVVIGGRGVDDVNNDLVDGSRSAVRGTCQSMKAQGQLCWTKTDVAYFPPHDMTDDCPCQRGLYCVANGVFLPGGEAGVCSV